MKMSGHALVTPAEAGVQETRVKAWIPACAGMTIMVAEFNWLFNPQQCFDGLSPIILRRAFLQVL